MDRYDEEMFDELDSDEAEGPADHYDEMDEAEGYDEADEIDEAEGYDEADEFDEGDEADEADEYDDAWDEAGESDELDEEAWDEAVAYALGAEDSDEFFRRLARGLGRAARGAVRAVRRAAPHIGRFARTIAPVASMIPGVGTAVGTVANVVGQLMADEASEEEALDAFAELAVRNRAALPVAAGLAARRVLGPAAARMPMRQRVAAVRTVRRAATQLVNRDGPTAIRALPRIARSVRRTGVVRRTPPAMRPRVLARTVGRVVQRNPRLRRQLTRPLPRGRRIVQRTRRAVMSGASPARLVLGGAVGLPGGSYGTYGGGFGGGGIGSGGSSSPARPT